MLLVGIVAMSFLGSDGRAMELSGEQAETFMGVALAGLEREYPNKLGQVLTGVEDLRSPRDLHPVFYGHFDWHSSVHGHWSLVRLAKRFPEVAGRLKVKEVLDGRFTEAGLKAEAGYFEKKENRSFERMYGWAWALRLAVELRSWDDDAARRWVKHYLPLEETIVELAKGYLPKLDWPIRTGVHPDAGWAFGQFLDYARAVGDREFEALVVAKASGFYGGDRDYPVAYEPSGNDFFSSGLNEADVMRRVLGAREFGVWLDGFFPGLAERKMGNLLEPVSVSDVADGHLVHLAGLNLNRAWTMAGVAAVLPEGDARRVVLEESAERHTRAGLGYVTSGHYEGEHWLASFAVYVLTGVGIFE